MDDYGVEGGFHSHVSYVKRINQCASCTIMLKVGNFSSPTETSTQFKCFVVDSASFINATELMVKLGSLPPTSRNDDPVQAC